MCALLLSTLLTLEGGKRLLAPVHFEGLMRVRVASFYLCYGWLVLVRAIDVPV